MSEEENTCGVCKLSFTCTAVEPFCCKQPLHKECAQGAQNSTNKCPNCLANWGPVMVCEEDTCKEQLITLEESNAEAHINNQHHRLAHVICGETEVWSWDSTFEQYSLVSCGLCEMTLPRHTTIIDYEIHIAEAHSDADLGIRYACHQCVNPNARGLTFEQLILHLKNKYPNSDRKSLTRMARENALWYCLTCKKSTKAKSQTPYQVQKHIVKNKHTNMDFKFLFSCNFEHCRNSNIASNQSISNIEEHIQISHSAFTCGLCDPFPVGEFSQSIQVFYHHFLLHHIKWVCPIGHCEHFPDKEDAISHINNEHEKELFIDLEKCKYCPALLNKANPETVGNHEHKCPGVQ